MRWWAFAMAASCLAAGVAWAEERITDLPGWRIAGAGVGRPGAAAVACSVCHAIDGAGIGGALPRIGAMDRAYLSQTMHAYADNSRNNAVMGGVARALTAAEIDAVTAWFASANPLPFPAAQADATLVALGRDIAERGLPGKGVNACQSCHGNAAGAGVVYAVPYLQGQSAAYIQLQFEAWGRGLRSADPVRVMNAIAVKLDPREVEALAAYYASLPPPPPSPAEAGADFMQ